jgi:hypothetical protein
MKIISYTLALVTIKYVMDPAALNMTVQESFLMKRKPINSRTVKDISMSHSGIAMTVPPNTARAFPPRKPRNGE